MILEGKQRKLERTQARVELRVHSRLTRIRIGVYAYDLRACAREHVRKYVHTYKCINGAHLHVKLYDVCICGSWRAEQSSISVQTEPLSSVQLHRYTTFSPN